VVSEIEEPAVLPGVGPGFPPVAGIGKDPLRWPREKYRDRAEALRQAHPRAAQLWLPCLTTDLAIDSQGRGAISPFLAPSGQQKLRTFFEKPLHAVRANPGHLHDALVRWRRVEGFTGEYLDHHVLRSAADDPRGRTGQEAGVPGATWLATMALPLFRLTGDGTRVRSTLWHRVARNHLMIWPLWHPTLDLEAVRCLLEHPAFRPIDEAPTLTTASWDALGIIAVYGARRHRIPGRTFDGVLTTTTIHTR
jgi:CRISPR-associated endonuclease/helicase Cas3